MRADRLMSILLILQRKGKVTTRELAEELEASPRTILRDLNALSGMGIPVVADRGKNGGWRLLDHYRKTLLTLNKEEIASLFLSFPDRYLKDLGLNRSYHTARQKLFPSLPLAAERRAQKFWERIHIDTEPWKKSGGKKELDLEPMVRAVFEERKVTMEYERADGLKSKRMVEPLGLVARGNQWYLVAQNEEGIIKSYKTGRIRSITVLEESFRRPPGFDLAAHWRTSKEQFVTKLPEYLVKAELTPQTLKRIRFSDRFVRVLDAGEPGPDGWISATLRFDTEQEAMECILGYNCQIRVLSPEKLKRKVVDLARSVVELYEQE
ncbi:helix-turn-helix transcriptional regulator [Lihuaxuella thermophila]|uniref:Predicted DNA-binding transcriptional regulator YafY, contains an HTH and WYL domains n=1 Tax=Lihuaxuella thermophila TaxID=1173111 RepID=A0A1H8C605_9BACL|nr:YafY family protein [Lihuaxuella thermophila]SEM89527.1 Predicted DNA-binding transcriptional regulator YafY, contains an HTH and WYL domains [Lihuaxuella thermophila]